jgi:hypothetical protein
VLVVGCEDAWVDDCSPGDVEALVDGLGAEDTGSANFVGPFACLVEHECKDVLVVGDGDAVCVNCMIKTIVIASIHLHALQYELTLTHNSCAPSAVVGVFPTNAAVLLVYAHDVGHL